MNQQIHGENLDVRIRTNNSRNGREKANILFLQQSFTDSKPFKGTSLLNA